MTVEALLIIIGLCLFCIYFVFEYQRAAVPPYQEPLKCTGDCNQGRECVCTQQPVAKESLDNIDNWNAKIGDKIWYKEAAPELDTPLNPKATWPFPSGDKP
jgi:hypothetical protein